jgi:hypothetical protein
MKDVAVTATSIRTTFENRTGASGSFNTAIVKLDDDGGLSVVGTQQLISGITNGASQTKTFTIKNRLPEGTYKLSPANKAARNDVWRPKFNLRNHYIEAVVEHNQVPSKKDETKMSTFANFGDKFPADGFTEEPCERALTLGPKSESKTTRAKKSAQKASQKPTKAKSGGLDLDALLGG